MVIRASLIQLSRLLIGSLAWTWLLLPIGGGEGKHWVGLGIVMCW